MLLYLLAHDALLAGCLVDFEKQSSLLIPMVLLNQSMPGEGVSNKIRIIRLFQARCLLVDAVEAPDEGVMTDAHVRCLHREAVGL